jgi:hypothetical protein
MKMKPFVAGNTFAEGWTAHFNGKYQVMVRDGTDQKGARLITLSVRREDRKPIMDWRDMQWIKNFFLGPETEAVQLFPAESRLVDTCNQYYLFAYPDPTFRFPFGFEERMVGEKVSICLPGGGRSLQRPFAEHVKPPDLEEMERKGAQVLKDFGLAD